MLFENVSIVILQVKLKVTSFPLVCICVQITPSSIVRKTGHSSTTHCCQSGELEINFVKCFMHLKS